MSNLGLRSSDLLASIATLQSGQSSIGGRGGAGIGSGHAYPLSPWVWRSAQYKVAANTPNASAMSATTSVSIGIVCPSLHSRS